MYHCEITILARPQKDCDKQRRPHFFSEPKFYHDR